MLERHVPDNAVLALEGFGAVVYRYEKNGRPISLAYAGKAKKPTYHYRFDNAEKQAEYDQKFLENRRASEEMKAQHRAEKNAMHTLKVGDIMLSSWGWEQTNVDFYQVVEVKGRTVVLQEIGCKTVGEPTSWASDEVVADPQFKIGEPFKKRADGFNRVTFESYKSARLWDGKKTHRSWYA